MKERLEQIAYEHYITQCSSPELEVLTEISYKAQQTLTHPRMVSGHIQGLFLKLIVEMIRPKKILELGTFIGYSTICLALGLEPSGKLTTIEVNDELEARIRSNLSKAGVEDKVELLIGDAIEIIKSLPIEQYGLIYLDANKAQYPEYFESLVERAESGTFIIADNTLWNGKLWHSESHDPQTEGIRKFNKMVASDDRVEQVLLPLRDGLTIIRIK